MLDIDKLTRFMLLTTGALELNEQNDEVLVGLTLSESNFFINCVKRLPSSRSVEDAFRFAQLKNIHEKALMKKLWV